MFTVSVEACGQLRKKNPQDAITVERIIGIAAVVRVTIGQSGSVGRGLFGVAKS